jgi:hypothetical protein
MRAHRVLPPQAIRVQLRDLKAALPLLGHEGFSAVIRFASAEEVDAARVITHDGAPAHGGV